MKLSRLSKAVPTMFSIYFTVANSEYILLSVRFQMMYNILIYLHKTIKAASNNNCLTNLETELKAIKVHFNPFTHPTGKTSDS